jgi:hypothetical protein
VSPYSVEYPTAASDLLPVVSTSQPNLLDRAMRVTPRMRLCRFSSVRSSSRPVKLGSSMSMRATWAGSMAMVRWSTPNRPARSAASVSDPSLEYLEGMATVWTRSGPMASAATTATMAESTPPDRAMTTSENPFFSM